MGFNYCCFLKRSLSTPNPCLARFAINGHGSAFGPLQSGRSLIRDGKNNSLKRTSRPNVLTSYRLKKKVAFTLAEVLITLGIIGVVAAITIPGLVADYQKKVLVAQFKKSYSNLSNALNLVQAEYGTVYECYNTGFGRYHINECKPFFEQYVKKTKYYKRM